MRQCPPLHSRCHITDGKVPTKWWGSDKMCSHFFTSPYFARRAFSFGPFFPPSAKHAFSCAFGWLPCARLPSPQADVQTMPKAPNNTILSQLPKKGKSEKGKRRETIPRERQKTTAMPGGRERARRMSGRRFERHGRNACPNFFWDPYFSSSPNHGTIGRA